MSIILLLGVAVYLLFIIALVVAACMRSAQLSRLELPEAVPQPDVEADSRANQRTLSQS